MHKCWILLMILMLSGRVGLCDTHYVSINGWHITPYTNWLTAATNINAAVKATSDSDTVLVTNGTYTGPQNRGITITNYIILSSLNGPDVTIVDCETNNFGFKVEKKTSNPTTDIP